LGTCTNSEDDSYHEENDSYDYKIATNLTYGPPHRIFYSSRFFVMNLFGLVSWGLGTMRQVVQLSTTIGAKPG
jgi:hypothetical protein